MAPKIVVTGQRVGRHHLETLRQAGLEVENPTDFLPDEDLVCELDGADGYLLAGDEIVSRGVLQQCPSLKVVAFLGVGYGSFVDIAAATELGIAVTHTPDSNTTSVAELTVGHILNARRRITYLNNRAKTGHMSQRRTSDLCGSAVGILGLGAIGTAVARIVRHGFGCRILYHSRTKKPDIEAELGAEEVSFRRLLRDSDVLVIMVPTCPETVGILGEEELALMRPDALLINTARASLVDGMALRRALDRGALGTVAFDGYYVEPLPEPDNDPFGLLAMPDDRFVVTPHTAAQTHDAAENMARKAVSSVIDFFGSGENPHLVNPEYSQHLPSSPGAPSTVARS